MQKTTLILVLIALGLGGYVYFYEIKSTSQEKVAGNSQQNLFSFTEDQVQRLTIEKEKQIFEFIRLETSDTSWRMKKPEGAPAKESSIVFLLDLLSSESSSRTFEIQRDQLEEYGFKTPLATIEVELDDNTKHRVVLGKTTLNDKQIYARIDPDQNQSNIDIHILPIDFKNAVNRSLSEWKQQPEAETKAEKNNQTEPKKSSSEKQE
ncbi:MAG: hypothetical protein BRC33_12860 [Cyanobacteria bacterium SW_9_44_58]|nr:MAG: hypothetical protein BRC33_12860 [Cyanobacteria bacterium SW_9_44_58]